MHDPSLACTAKGCSGGISFATCSTDGTIRLWDISLQSDLSKDAKELKNELLGSSCLGNSRPSKFSIQLCQKK
jgi:mitogen-activated protein kinase binding protein 1